MLEEGFAASRSIKEEKTRGRSKPYFSGIEREPLKLTVSFAFKNTWDEDLIRSVRRWLTEQDYYKPLIFSENNSKIYYAICVDEPILIHNSLKQGYVKINFRCNDAYAYSPLITSKTYDWDETKEVITKDDFSDGVFNGVVLNENNRIALDSEPKTWLDIPNTSWRDL